MANHRRIAGDRGVVTWIERAASPTNTVTYYLDGCCHSVLVEWKYFPMIKEGETLYLHVYKDEILVGGPLDFPY